MATPKKKAAVAAKQEMQSATSPAKAFAGLLQALVEQGRKGENRA